MRLTLKKPDLTQVVPVVLGSLLAIGLIVAGIITKQDILVRYATTDPQTEKSVAPKPVVVAAVGDISCPPDLPVADDGCQMAAVRDAILRSNPDHVLVLGDLQYNAGEPEHFKTLFSPLWAGLKSRSFAVPGNHEYYTAEAKGYYDYWNDTQPQSKMAGETGKGYYSFDLGFWHLFALNSNCEYIGGCGEGSDQVRWLRQASAQNQTKACSLAFWHHPFFTSGRYANDTVSKNRSSVFWDTLQQTNTEIVLNGHEHLYERFATQNKDGLQDPNGIRQFVVGTGGYGYAAYPFKEPRLPTHEFGARTFGFLRLELKESSYSWQFIDINDQVLDHGVGICR
ncbi:MAG: metallophosphoesterase [Candidatus Saccharibacteria bacterium]|nr:metallophosphoesterase [Candidatus Saccharibacteria bacterium]